MTVVARRLALGACFALALAASSPLYAQSAVTIPEPTDVTLLALAVAGLLIGRRVARRRKDD